MEQPNESQKRKLEEEEAPETEVKAEEPTAKKAKTETSADDKAKVKKQIEYYFSDSNYRRDKWLLEEAAKHPEGYIEIEKIAAFPRLQALTTDLDVVVDIMRSSDRLTVSEDGKLVKRAHPLPDVDDSVQRTIFAKGLGGEVNIDAVEAHFCRYGPVARVSLFREKETKKPKGEAFIEFETQEAAKAAAAEEKQDYNGNEVTVKPKMAAREKPQKAERKRKANDEEKEGEEEKDDAEEQQKRREERLQRMQGTVLHITLSSDEGQEFNPDFNKWDIKTLVEEVLPTDQIKFVDFSAKQAWIRVDNPDAAKKALAALTETTKEVKGVKFTNPRVLEGGEENLYLEKILEEGDRKFGKKGGRGGGRGGKRGRGGRGGRRGGRSRD